MERTNGRQAKAVRRRTSSPRLSSDLTEEGEVTAHRITEKFPYLPAPDLATVTAQAPGQPSGAQACHSQWPARGHAERALQAQAEYK